MTRSRLMCMAFACLCVAGCGEGQGQRADGVPETVTGAEAVQDDKTYSANGTITAIAGNQVTIAHEAVKGLDWPAATADFQAQKLDQIIDLRPGDKVSFSFNQAGGQYILTRIERQKG